MGDSLPKSHVRAFRFAPAIRRGAFGKLAAAAVVGAMGVGVTASAATAVTEPPPAAPATDRSLADSGVDQAAQIRHPSTFMSKRTASEQRTTSLAKTQPPDDFDGDGMSEIVYTGLGGNVYVNSSRGTSGSFTDQQDFDMVITPGDLDGDGRNDVVARTHDGQLRLYNRFSPTDPDSMSHFEVIGGGWQIYNRVVGAGDISGDGLPDLLARTPSGDLYLYRGNANGTLAARTRIGGGWGMYDQVTVTGDVSGDGFRDVLARTPSGDLYLYPGKAGGTLGARAMVGRGWAIYNQIVAGGDYNGDGRADVLGRTRTGDMYAYSATGAGTLSSPVRAGAPWNWALSIAGMGGGIVYGKEGLVARTPGGAVNYYSSNGQGGLQGFSPLYTSGWPAGKPIYHAVSLNSDVKSEILTTSNAKDLGLLDSDIMIATKWTGKTATVGLGDITGDGWSDIVARTSDGTLQVHPGRASGRLGAPTTIGGGWNIYNALIGAGDMSGDGVADLVARTSTGDLYLYKGLANGKFADRVKIGHGWNIYGQIAAPGDLDGDGLADIVGTDNGGTLWRYKSNAGGTVSGRTQIGYGWHMYNGLF